MAREDIGRPLLLIYTTVSVCLSVRPFVCQIFFFFFARAFWAWISSHAFVLPAKLDSRPQSVHPLRHMPIWAVDHIAIQAEGTRDQWT